MCLIFRPADNFIAIVDARGKSIIATQRWKLAHHAIPPDESKTDVPVRSAGEDR